MAQVTGYRRPPMHPGGFADPMIAMHAGVALQAALEHRDRTGEGQIIEVAQLETACCLTADQPMDFELNGRIATRTGNRDSRMAPQGVYRCRDDEWVALSVRNDSRLARAPRGARPAVVGHRRLRHLGRPAAPPRRPRPARGGVVRRRTTPTSIGRPVARARAAGRQGAARPGDVRRPAAQSRVSGTSRSRTPRPACGGTRRGRCEFSFAKAPHRFGPPTLGQHNAEVLAELGRRARGIGPARGRGHHRRPDGGPLSRLYWVVPERRRNLRTAAWLAARQ